MIILFYLLLAQFTIGTHGGALATPRAAVTWYVDSIGGNRYSTNKTAGLCDGTADTAPVGTTPNQHCAFNDVRYLWADGSYNASEVFPGWGWVAQGGDTIIIKNCIQYSAPTTPIPGSSGPCRIGPSGPNATDWFLGVAGNNGVSGMPTLPAGSTAHHTTIIGYNFVSCMMSCPTNTVKTELYGGYGTGSIIGLGNTQYIDLVGLELDDHVQCAQIGIANQCARSYPVDDYATSGISSKGAANITLTDVSIHGLANNGWYGPIGGNVTMNRVYIGFNTSAGINLDNGSGIGSSGGMFTISNSTIEANGCLQEYPIVDTFPAFNCFDQSSGGYGDAIGTPNNDAASFTVQNSIIRYNTQDGVDLLHSFGGTILISNSQIYGNEGQSIKLGATSSSIIHDNLIVNNCYVLQAGYNFPGAPTGFNVNLNNTCRGNGDIFAISWGDSTTVEEIDNNTVIAGGSTLLDISCGKANCSTGTKTLRNNVFIGYAVSGYNANQTPGTFCYSSCNNGSVLTNATMWTARSNNIYYNFRACPAGTFANESCVDPTLTTELSTAAPLNNESFQYSAFAFPLLTGSPAIHTGIAISGLTTDFNGNPFANPPSMGAIEF